MRVQNVRDFPDTEINALFSSNEHGDLSALENKTNVVKQFSNYVVLVLAGLNDARFKNGFLT